MKKNLWCGIKKEYKQFLSKQLHDKILFIFSFFIEIKGYQYES